MKQILIALFTVFACCQTFAEPAGGFIPQIPPIYAHPDVVEYAIKKYVVAPYDPNKVTAAYEQYMNQNDGTITLENLQQKVCPAGGMDKARCKEFTNALMVPYYDVCDSGKGKSDGNEHCINNFFYYAAPKNLSFGQGTYVRLKEAIGLAQEYALIKDKQKVVCVSDKGNSKKTDTIWCTSIDKKHFYEFKFNNIKETKDDYIKQSLLGAICKLHNTQYIAGGVGAATLGTTPGYSWPDSCETADQFICTNINKSLGRFSYKATIGTSDVPPTGKHSTCVIEKVVNDVSNLRTAYGIDPSVFKNIQALAGEDIDKKIKQYVKQELQKQKITFDEKSFHCADSTNVLNGGDVLTCYVNNKPIDFLFADLSEWKGINKRGGAQAMDCIVSGGTYTGKRCINLNQKQCEMLRSANLKSCPSCNMVRWDAKNNVCTLPSSAAATNLQKDMKVVAIVGGAVVGAAITIATAGTAGLTVGGYVILGVETTGAGIEWWAQSKIDKLSDEFFLKANNCNNENCAAQLIEQYLTDLAAIDRDLTTDEADAVDKEIARLVELIPTNSNWWIDKLRNEDGTSFLEKADNGHWTAAQVWRAVGIGMQFAGVVSSVTGWILTKTGYLEKTLKRTSKVLTKRVETVSMDFWNGTNYRVGNSLERELTLLEELRDARQGKTGSRLGSAVLDDLSDETKMLLAQNGNDVDAVIRQMSKGLESVNQNTLILNRELQLLDELEDAKQAKTGSRMYSGVYEDLSEETKRLLAQNGNDISKARQRLNLAAQKLEYKPGNQTLGDFILSPDLESIGGEYSTWNSELSKLKKDVVTKQANGEDATRALAKLRSAASDAVDARLIEQNAIFYKENIARILASDEDLLKQFNNFENLSHGAKERFVRTFINRHGTNLGVSEDVEISLISKFADDPEAIGRCCGVNNVTGKRIIYISEDNLIKAGNGSAKNGLIAAPSHEYGHFVDGVDPNKGVLGSQVSDISQNFYGKQSNKTLEGWLTYTSRPTEKSSFPIGNIVGDDFSDGLRQTITAGKMPTTTISKIDDFKIKYAVPNINPTYVENGGDAYFFIQARPENITGLSNYFRQKGLRVKTTTYGVRVFEKL